MIFIKNIKNVFMQKVENSHIDSGDLVQTVLITAGFAVTAVLLIAWYGSSIAAQGVKTANCVSGGTVESTYIDAVGNCDDNTQPEEIAEQNDEDYQNRFGSTDTTP